MGAIKAVFRSWDNPRAHVYRRDNDIPYSWGTAVNVQSMAFGNMGDDCGTGKGEYGIAPAPVSEALQKKVLGEGGKPVDCRIEDQKRTGQELSLIHI